MCTHPGTAVTYKTVYMGKFPPYDTSRARGDPSVKLLSNLLAKTMAKTCSWNRSATGALPANRCSSDDCRRRP